MLILDGPGPGQDRRGTRARIDVITDADDGDAGSLRDRLARALRGDPTVRLA